jgi:hypothetical protein
VIRLELHYLFPRLNTAGKAAASQVFRITPGFEKNPWSRGGQQWRARPTDPWQILHDGGQAEEYAAFNLARQISVTHSSPDAPFQSVSIGFGQIMGKHYQTLRYPTAESMWQDAWTMDGQTRQFLGFLAADPKLINALRARDLRTVVRIYNGPGQVDVYMAKLEDKLRRTV